MGLWAFMSCEVEDYYVSSHRRSCRYKFVINVECGVINFLLLIIFLFNIIYYIKFINYSRIHNNKIKK